MNNEEIKEVIVNPEIFDEQTLLDWKKKATYPIRYYMHEEMEQDDMILEIVVAEENEK